MTYSMAESMLFDSSQYFRFPMKELEDDYVMYLSGSLSKAERPSPSAKARLSLESGASTDEKGGSSDGERSGAARPASAPRSRRNTSSSNGRRRKRTEGEEGGDALSYDLNHHCKFSGVAELEMGYLMLLSGTLGDSGSNGKAPGHKNGKPRSQAPRERSSKSSEKTGRRVTPTEERKVSPTDFEEAEAEMRNGARGRYRAKPRPIYPRTPYQGVRRCFGEFQCPRCYRQWTSANSRANRAQQCNGCGLFVYPHSQWPLTWPMMRPDMEGGWDELEDQENRHMGRAGPEDGFDHGKLGNGDRRPPYRPRHPLRPHHRRRREQEV